MVPGMVERDNRAAALRREAELARELWGGERPRPREGVPRSVQVENGFATGTTSDHDPAPSAIAAVLVGWVRRRFGREQSQVGPFKPALPIPTASDYGRLFGRRQPQPVAPRPYTRSD